MKVALTFDAEHPDRPGCVPGVPDRILDVLDQRGVRATFFMQGRWVQAYPETARRIACDGHRVGSHSFYHAHLSHLSPQGLVADVRQAETAIRDIARSDPRPWFRCPWGYGWDDPKVTEVLSELGYRHVGWDVIAYDWEPGTAPDSILQVVVAGVMNGHREAIVLLHQWPEQTLLALPGILDRLIASGTEFVGVDGLDRVTDAGMVDRRAAAALSSSRPDRPNLSGGEAFEPRSRSPAIP